LEEIPADGLLKADRLAPLDHDDVGSVPELVEVLALVIGQHVEPRCDRPLQRPLAAGRQVVGRHAA